MVDRHRAIEEFRQRIRRLEAESRSLLQRLGEYLSYQPAESFSGTPLADTHARIQGLRERLPETRKQIKGILQSVSRSEELDKSIRQARARLAPLQEEGERISEQIGRAAFEAYRSARPQASEYEEIFGTLLRQDEEIVSLELEIQNARSGNKGGNFFRIFRESGRTLYAKGLLSLKKKSMIRDYRQAGRRFCDSDLIGGITDPELKRAVAPYQENKKKVDQLGGEIESLRSRQEALWEELKEMGAEKSHQRRVREIEHQIEEVEEEVEADFGSLGSMYRAKPMKRFAEDPEIKKILRQVARVEKSAEQYRIQITRVEASFQVNALEKQRAGMEERIARLEREIKSRQEEIRSLRERVAEAQKEKQRLVEIRGPEETLLRRGDGATGDGETEGGGS